MTFLEKVKKDNPNIKLKDSGAPMACPFELGYEEDYDCEEVKCIDCWNREMPNTEAKEDVYKEDMNTAYNKGLNDAWELAKEMIANLDGYEILSSYTPQEAIAKLKAYEEAQDEIKVGDVVTYSGEKCLVLDLKGDKVVVLTGDCCVLEWHKCDVEKTGKHIELDGLLEQIGE